jgi:hypothetical protein
MSRLRLALIVGVYAVGLPSIAAAQDHWLRDRVRETGDLALAPFIACGGYPGLKEIVDYTQLTVEGVVSRADSALTPDESSLYTDYIIDVTRVFRMPPAMVSRRTPGATDASPFVAASPGEHVIVSAYFDQHDGLWLPLGVFAVRDGRVINLQPRLQVGDYESIAQFASALANPPPTTLPPR